MRTRSTHLGGWRWRLRVFPWAYVLSTAWLVLMLAAFVVVLLIVTTGERVS